MDWKVMVAAGQSGWDRKDWILGLDATEEWTEAWDDIVQGYRKQAYQTEAAAAAVARRLRACGYTASTDQEPAAV